MLILLAIIFLLILFLEHFTLPSASKNGIFSLDTIRAVLFVLFALVLIVFLLRSGIALIPALAIAISTALMLAEKKMAPIEEKKFFEQMLHAKKPPPPPPSQSSHMTEEEARAILNVAPNASKQEVKKAYHALITKNHPDHGGSSYLAAKINQARDRLI